MKFALVIQYWGDDPVREKNTIVCHKYWQAFVEFCKSNSDHEVVLHVHDWSGKLPFATKQFEPIDHEYMRAIRFNMSIKEVEGADVFAPIDSDILILPRDFKQLESEMCLGQYRVFRLPTYDIADERAVDYFAEELRDSCPFDITHRDSPAIAGVSFSPWERLNYVGGMDERLLVWGGEDNDLSQRLNWIGVRAVRSDIKSFHLPHVSLSHKSKGTIQYEKQLVILDFDKTVRRPTLLNGYNVGEK